MIVTIIRPRQLGWPAAATLIAAIIGAAAATSAFDSGAEHVFDDTRYASAREIAEVKARLQAIEISTQQMRTELRGDMKELREMLAQLVRSE